MGNATTSTLTTLTWDDNGNRSLLQSPAGLVTLTWDERDRLAGVSHPIAGSYSMSYDYSGLRVGQQAGDGSLASYAYVGTEVHAWQRGTTLTHLMVQGEGHIRSVGIQDDGSALNRQFHADGLGSTVATSTGSQGIETRYQTDAWGNLQAGEAKDNPFVYGGGDGYWQESDLGLTYVQARWLDTQTGSWLSVDPVSSEPLFSYAHNSPTAYTDPTGTQANSLLSVIEGSGSSPRARALLRELHLAMQHKIAPTMPDVEILAMYKYMGLSDADANFLQGLYFQRHQAKLPVSRYRGSSHRQHRSTVHSRQRPQVSATSRQRGKAGSPAAADLAELQRATNLSIQKEHDLRMEEARAIHDYTVDQGWEKHGWGGYYLNQPLPLGGNKESTAGLLDTATFGITGYFHRQIFGREIHTETQNYKNFGSLGMIGMMLMPELAGLRALPAVRAPVSAYLTTGTVITGVQGATHIGISASQGNLSWENNFLDVVAIGGLTVQGASAYNGLKQGVYNSPGAKVYPGQALVARARIYPTQWKSFAIQQNLTGELSSMGLADANGVPYFSRFPGARGVEVPVEFGSRLMADNVDFTLGDDPIANGMVALTDKFDREWLMVEKDGNYRLYSGLRSTVVESPRTWDWNQLGHSHPYDFPTQVAPLISAADVNRLYERAIQYGIRPSSNIYSKSYYRENTVDEYGYINGFVPRYKATAFPYSISTRATTSDLLLVDIYSTKIINGKPVMLKVNYFPFIGNVKTGVLYNLTNETLYGR